MPGIVGFGLLKYSSSEAATDWKPPPVYAGPSYEIVITLAQTFSNI